MATWEPDEIDFEDQYDKIDPIDDEDLDASMTLLKESIQEQEELESRISRAEWKSTNKGERMKLEQQIAFNEKKQGLYIMRASKTIISILHRGFDKIKDDGRVMVLDENSAEKLRDRLYLVESEGTYKVTFENESKTLTLFQLGGGGGGIHPPPSFSLAIATKINRSPPNFLTFNFYYRDII